MGKYINEDQKGKPLPNKGKAKVLLQQGAKIAEQPIKFQSNLVCVVDNGMFEAAGYADTEQEMEAFLYPDGRPKIWLIVDNAESLAK